MLIQNRTLASSLLPSEVVKAIENKNVTENAVCAVAILILNTAIGAMKVWLKGSKKGIDPNAGNGGCQEVATCNYMLFLNAELKKEGEKLKDKAEEKREEVNKRKTAKKVSQSVSQFFKNCDLSVSEEMEYLLQSYLLAATRKVVRRQENGVILTKTDCGLLPKISKQICFLPIEMRRKITEHAQSVFTANSHALFRKMAERITILEDERKKRMLLMLSEEMTHVYTPSPEYEPKTFGCLFYEFQAMLCLLREEKALVAYKSIEKEKKPFHLLFQPKKANESFSLVPDKAYTSFSLDTPIIIFEGVCPLEREKFKEQITKFNFSDVMLACAAIEPQFERCSKLEDVKYEWAKEEILEFRKFYEEKMESLWLLDHVYFNTLEGEFKS